MTKKRTSKLSPQPVLDLVTEMTRAGASLSEICAALAAGAPGRDPVVVSATAVRSRILQMGLALSTPAPRKPFVSPSAEAIESIRRSSDSQFLVQPGPARPPAWLLSFEPEIRRLLAETNATLSQVWDGLAYRFGSISPHLAREMSNDKKSQAIYIFIAREAAKAKRKNKMNWARTYIEVGRHALASAPTKPVDAPVPNKIPISMPAGAGKSFSRAVTQTQPQALPANTDNAALQAQLKSQGDGHSITSNMPPKRVLGERAGYSSGSTDPEAILRAELGPDAK